MSFKTDMGEMQRRWKVTLEAMAKEGIDCLVLGQAEGICPGASIYLTDMLPYNYPAYFLFSKDGIGFFGLGPFGGKLAVPYDFVTENITVPSIPGTSYAAKWFPEEMTKVIKKFGYKKIGWCGMYNIPAGIYKYLTENLANVEFCDFSDTMDHIKAVKSPYELKLWGDCVKLHDNLMAAVPAIMQSGRTERDFCRRLRNIADDMGCTQMNIMVGAHPTRPRQLPYGAQGRHGAGQGRMMEKGDYVQLLIEVAAAENVWAECGRVFAIGTDVSPIMQKALADQIKVQDYVAQLSVPGAKASDVFLKMNEMLNSMGYRSEKRFCVHGQGYEIVDRPMWVAEETMVLQENMFFASHPSADNDQVLFNNCDNYVVEKGGSRRLSKTPREIVIIDK